MVLMIRQDIKKEERDLLTLEEEINIKLYS